MSKSREQNNSLETSNLNSEKEKENQKIIVNISIQDTLDQEHFTFIQNYSTLEKEKQGMEALIEAVWNLDTEPEPVNNGRTTLHDIQTRGLDGDNCKTTFRDEKADPQGYDISATHLSTNPPQSRRRRRKNKK